MNCPNCAAPIIGDICEYCGTVFHRPSKFEAEKLQAQFMQYDVNKYIVYSIRLLNSGVIGVNEIRKEFGLKEI